MIGNLILYLSLWVGAAAIASLYRNIHSKLFIRILAALLFIDVSLLTYYFVTSDFSVLYVWQYSNVDLPLIYKLSGVLAGQQGTLLFWAFLISASGLLLSERNAPSDFIRHSLMIVVLLGMYFIGLTLVESPFDSYPDASAIPADGNGLNPLLIDPWMAVHPPLIFLGYASMAVPFALAIFYLFVSRKEDVAGEYKAWIKSAKHWCRVSWLFLTLGIAVGGFWSYKVLGWGGFWAWDPVETSSLVPWLLLTGTLHALVEHNRDRRAYSILAPALVAASFILVIYATLVTRSGFFESIHAFGSSNVETYLVALIALCIAASAALVVMKYLNTSTAAAEKENMKIVFYIAILLFAILTFISFWGTTFPAIAKIATGRKYGIGIPFYNIWSYPFVLCLVLLAGFGINYKSSTRNRKLQELLFVALLTLAAAFINPSGKWNIVNYSAIVNPDKPLLYALIGSISTFSLIPPVVYLLYSIAERGGRLRAIKKRSYLVKEAGILSIHTGATLILIGAVFSMISATEFSTSLYKDSGETAAHVPPYTLKLLGYDERVDYGARSEEAAGISVAEFYDELHKGTLKDEYTVRGTVTDTLASEHAAYLKLGEGSKTLWVATNAQGIHSGLNIVATGSLMFDFKSDALNRTFDVIMFSNDIGAAQKIVSITKEVKVAVYQDSGKIAEGTAQVVQYPQSDVKRVMIDRGILKDVYVIFSGIEGNEIPLNVKIIPLVNFMWLGIILLAAGITAVLCVSKSE